MNEYNVGAPKVRAGEPNCRTSLRLQCAAVEHCAWLNNKQLVAKSEERSNEALEPAKALSLSCFSFKFFL